jgi:hypothetical protein
MQSPRLNAKVDNIHRLFNDFLSLSPSAEEIKTVREKIIEELEALKAPLSSNISTERYFFLVEGMDIEIERYIKSIRKYPPEYYKLSESAKKRYRKRLHGK